MQTLEHLPETAEPATPGPNGQTVGYVRVSTADQNTARQYEALGVAAGDVDQVFEDRISGKSVQPRTELRRMIEYVRQGDVVRVASFDRLARSLADLIDLVTTLNRKGVAVEFVKERLVFRPGETDPLASFQMHVLGAVAELERALIHERQREGIAVAKRRGKYKGTRPHISPDALAAARQRLDAGVSKSRVARDLGVSRATLYAALGGSGAYASDAYAERPVGDG